VSIQKSVFIWTEAFNCTEILPPFLESFRKHHDFPLNVLVSQEESHLVPKVPGVKIYNLGENLRSFFYKNSESQVKKGYRSGHLGTARIWSHLIQERKEEYLIHLDADTVFLDGTVTQLISKLELGFDFVGTRRPYRNRGYRLEGKDATKLNKLPDVLNTDFIGFQRKAISNRYSPLLTRWIRGKRPLRHPVVDFFDPVILKAISRGRRILYIDSPCDGIHAFPNYDSEFFKNRISFAAVGSGLNFLKNPDVKTSPGYKSYALASFALYSKYLLDTDIGIPVLDNPEILAKLMRLDKKSWKLRNQI
jgi:hypothetical protein